MTTAQLNGFRGFSEILFRPIETRTAREMALSPHRLGDNTPDLAIEPDGTRWYWNVQKQAWCR